MNFLDISNGGQNSMSSKTPIVRQVSWPLVIPQFLAMACSVGIVHAAIRPETFSDSIFIGLLIYLTYSIGSRQIIISAHRAGMRLIKQSNFQEAIPQFEKSYQLLNRHKWIDRYRYLVLMSPSAIPYREMALVNIAYCHSQIGNADLTKEYYQKTLQEFPDSGLANAALTMIATIEKPGKPKQQDEH